MHASFKGHYYKHRKLRAHVMHMHTPSLTGPSIAVLLANIRSVLQQDPGTVQVTQSDSQVKRSSTTRVQRL